MTDWPEYESHKIVQALPICRVDRRDDGKVFITLRHEDGTKEEFEVAGGSGSYEAMKREAEHYATMYLLDGAVQVRVRRSPKRKVISNAQS